MTTRNHTSLKFEGGVYSLTITVMGWKHFFVKKEYLDFVVESLRFYQDNRNVNTVGYCLMPNHLHWILKLSSNDDDIVKVLRTLKSFTATQLIKKLMLEVQGQALPMYHLFLGNNQVHAEDPKRMLEYFAFSARNDFDQSHRFWQRDSDIKLIDSQKFLIQKLNYIHNNPVKERWNLTAEPVDYPYSSCRFYENGMDWNNLRIQSLF